MLVLDRHGLALGVELAGSGDQGRPANAEHLGGDTTARANSGCGQAWQASLLVWLLSRSMERINFVRFNAVAALAGGGIVVPAWHRVAPQHGAMRSDAVTENAAAGDLVAIGPWQVAQVKPAPPLAFAGHVHAESAVGLVQRGIEVAVLTPSPPPPLKWQVPYLHAGLADALRDLGQIDRVEVLARAGRVFHASGRHLVEPGRRAVSFVAAGVVWQTRQSTFCQVWKSELASSSRSRCGQELQKASLE